MAGEATNAASVAVLRRRYQDGVPRACFEDFPAFTSCPKKEDFTGDDYALAIQTENPQGVGITVGDAQGSAAQGNYVRFLLSRVEFFGVCRIKGQALRTATTKGGGALVDLWTNEMDGMTASVLKMLEIYFFGTGNAVLGTISSGNSTATLSLTTAEDVNNFDLGMRVQAVSDTTLSPTLRGGSGTITAIDRVGGTITASGNWNAAIGGLVNGDSLVRYGTAAVSSVAFVPAGLRQWLLGGTSPGTWKSLSRNSDPVRLAAQSLDATGLPMTNAVIDLESLITIQGKINKKVFWTNPRDVRQLKKNSDAKVNYPRTSMKSSVAGISFQGIEFDGDYAPIQVMTSPFCPKANGFMVDMTTMALYSSGPAPQPLDFDKAEFLRVATDDAYEARIGLYGDYGNNAPVKSARMTNWGV